MEGRNWSMYGLTIDVRELWPQRLNIRCKIHVDSVSGPSAYHVKRSSKLYSGIC